MIARSLFSQTRPLLRVPANRTFCQPFNLLSSRSDGHFDRPRPRGASPRFKPARQVSGKDRANPTPRKGGVREPTLITKGGVRDPSKSPGQNDLSTRRLFLENLPPWCDWISLKDHARSATGFSVAYASISVDPDGHSKQCGLIEFESPAHALDAVGLLDGSEMGEMAEDELPRRGSSSIAPPLRRPYVIRARMDRQQRERREGMSMGAIRLRLHLQPR
jgi:hypothetical protein